MGLLFFAGMQWNIPAEGLGYNRAYSFAYDRLNRLTAGNYTGGTTGTYNESFGYDKMGNITTLNRNESGTGLNQLTLNYTGNQLLTAYDALAVTKPYGSEAFDNKANLSTEYLYDANGSTAYDANSGISTIQYNVLNLPNIVQFTAGHKNIYTYGADGKKLETNNYTLHSAINVPQGSISTLPSNAGDYTKVTTDYVGNMIYENGSLKEILLPEGYWQSSVYYYYLKDHLGDNRVTINSSGTVIEKSHYYPSGMRFYPESSSNSAALPYRYNGKELEAMNGLNQYDYGARRRPAGLPMWTAVDPLAEKYYSMSPYIYCGGNPINTIDENGDSIRATQNFQNNKIIASAMKAILSTKAGYAYFARYAAKGDKLFGYEFQKNGAYSTKGIDLVFDTNPQRGNQGDTGIKRSSDKKGFDITMNISSKGEKGREGVFEVANTILHEGMLEAEYEVRDVINDRKIDYSNISKDIKEQLIDSYGKRTDYYNHYQNQIDRQINSYILFPGSAYNILKQINKSIQYNITNKQIQGVMGNYPGSGVLFPSK
jgi:RHS repeat-associated protein